MTDLRMRATEHRPWQVMLTWTTAEPPGPDLHKALGRILDLCPSTGSLIVHTQNGSIMATRDFAGSTSEEVGDILAGLFSADPAILGVTFPATSTRAAHMATPDNPYSLPAAPS